MFLAIRLILRFCVDVSRDFVGSSDFAPMRPAISPGFPISRRCFSRFRQMFRFCVDVSRVVSGRPDSALRFLAILPDVPIAR